MLWKSHISFNHLPAHEKEVLTYGESRKSSKFLRVAWNDSLESNRGNCGALKWWSIENLEREVFCAAMRYLHQLWECSVCEAMKRVWKLDHGLKMVWSPLDKSCGRHTVPISSKDGQCRACCVQKLPWSCWMGRLDLRHTKKVCWWLSVLLQPYLDGLQKLNSQRVSKILLKDFARVTDLFLSHLSLLNVWIPVKMLSFSADLRLTAVCWSHCSQCVGASVCFGYYNLWFAHMKQCELFVSLISPTVSTCLQMSGMVASFPHCWKGDGNPSSLGWM